MALRTPKNARPWLTKTSAMDTEPSWVRRWCVGIVRIYGPGAVVCLLSVLLTLGVMFPAAWMVPLCAHFTGGRVALIDAEGSLWNGSARLMLSPGGNVKAAQAMADADPTGGTSVTTVLPERFVWHASFWSLFSGEVRLTVQQDTPGSLPIRLVVQPSGAVLSAGTLGLPASFLMGLGAPFNTLRPDGDVTVDWTDWRMLANGATYGQATLRLANMGASVSTVRPLGTYRVHLGVAGRSMTLDLTTAQGPLWLSGHGEGGVGQRLRFEGQASSEGPNTPGQAQGARDSGPDAVQRAGQQRRLNDVLPMLGQPINDHTVRLQLR